MLDGSLQNRILETAVPETPEVGMGATIVLYSDRYAATVIGVNKGQVTVQEDKAVRTDSNGMSDCQSYTFERNPNGRIWNLSKRKNGQYVVVGNSTRNGTVAVLGVRQHYYDFNF